MGFLLVMKAEVVRALIIMRRYWFATIMGMAIGYAMLLMLVGGFMMAGDKVTGMMDGQQATTWAFRFIVGMLAFSVVGMYTQGLQGMARTGELEQVSMSPHGLVTLFLARSAVSVCTSIPSLAIILSLLAVTLKGTLHFAPFHTVVLLALTYTNLIGFGFMVGGLVLIFKQVGQIAMLLRLAMMGLAFVASEQVETWTPALRWAAHALPITDAVICLNHVIIRGQELDGRHVSVFAHPSFYFLIINALFWTSLGILCFRTMESYSRRKGTLGVY